MVGTPVDKFEVKCSFSGTTSKRQICQSSIICQTLNEKTLYESFGNLKCNLLVFVQICQVCCEFIDHQTEGRIILLNLFQTQSMLVSPAVQTDGRSLLLCPHHLILVTPSDSLHKTLCSNVMNFSMFVFS